MTKIDAIESTLTWMAPPGGVCLEHHFHGAHHLGSHYTPEEILDRAYVRKLARRVEAVVEPHEITLGHTRHVSDVTLLAFTVRWTVMPPAIWLVATVGHSVLGRKYHDYQAVILPKQQQRSFLKWAAKLHDDAHQALGLEPFWEDTMPDMKPIHETLTLNRLPLAGVHD